MPPFVVSTRAEGKFHIDLLGNNEPSAKQQGRVQIIEQGPPRLHAYTHPATLFSLTSECLALFHVELLLKRFIGSVLPQLLVRNLLLVV